MAKKNYNNSNNSNGSSGQSTQSNPMNARFPDGVLNMMRQKYPDFDGVMSGAPSGGIPPVGTVAPRVNVLGAGGVRGKFQPQGVQNHGNALVTDFTNMPKPPQFHHQGAQMSTPMMEPLQQPPYDANTANVTPQPQTDFTNMPKQPTGWNPDGSANYDSLSAALNGGYPASTMAAQTQQKPFGKDSSKRDGGFFGWLGSLLPKSRPGMRPGETEDDYDRRVTTSRERLAALADAVRHFGNIVNTSKGAPLQVFNDPTTMMEQGYQYRKAQRQKKDALAADAAYKQANLNLKLNAANADRVYKEYLAELQKGNAELARKKFDYQISKDAAADQYKKDKDKRDFDYKQGRDKVKDQQTERRLNMSQYNATHKGRGGRSGKGGSGSGGKYWFEDKNGNIKYQPNKTMWEQEYYREYGKLPEGETSTSTSTKTIDTKTGKEVTVTTRHKGASVTSQAAKEQNEAKAARNKPKPVQKSKNGYKNTKRLGL